jgi:radical SAM superfamily enzyme YgiQ (UPF0313 family)
MTPTPPLGLASIAACLERKGCTVRIFDQFAHAMSCDDLAGKIAGESPGLVGFACLTPAASQVKAAAVRLRALLPNAPIVLGNVHASVFAPYHLEEGLADFVVHGEGEDAMCDLVDVAAGERNAADVPGISFIESGRVVTTAPRPEKEDLDSLPLPAWHLLDLPRYPAQPMLSFTDVTLPVQASRGCPHACFFCAQNYRSRKVRKRSVIKVVDEIEHMHRTFGIDHFGFVDPAFPLAEEQGMEFSRELIARGLNRKITWITEMRVDAVTLPLLVKMKEAGLRLIMLGIETGSQEILDSVHKGAKLEHAREAIRCAKRAGVLTFGLFIVGLPGETRQTIEQTIRFAISLDIDIAKFNRAVPYPGSPFFERHCTPSDCLEHPERFTSWYEGEDIPFVPEGMTARELTALQREAIRRFYLRPRLILRHLLRGSVSVPMMLKGSRMLLGK